MCVIISIYNTKKDEKYNDVLKKNLFHFNTWNGDGKAHYGHGIEKGAKDKFSRQLKVTGEKWIDEVLDNEVNHIHFRKATHGTVNVENVHFWESEEWIFAHNGMTEVGAQRLGGSSDSKMLFEMLLKSGAIKGQNININRIADIVNGISFWGRLLIINRKTKSAYYFGDYHLYMLGKDMLVVSTQELTLNNGRSIYGIPFDYQSTEILHNKFDGIMKINPIRREHKEYDIEFTPSYGYSSLYDGDYGLGGWHNGGVRMTEIGEDDDIPPAHTKKKKKGNKKQQRMELEAIRDIEQTVKTFAPRQYLSEGQDWDREGLKEPKEAETA